ncbi:hypothetical protein I4U23_025358 [Adineta vaga]|nr:hypothetical protein I4U23_025358 [Adineta vaga]
MIYAKILLIILLLNVVCKSTEATSSKRKGLKLTRPISPEHDNRYVWFTRDIHEDTNIDEFQSQMEHSKKYSSKDMLNILLNKYR